MVQNHANTGRLSETDPCLESCSRVSAVADAKLVSRYTCLRDKLERARGTTRKIIRDRLPMIFLIAYSSRVLYREIN